MIKISAKKTKFRKNNKSENPNFSQAMLTLKRVEIKIFSINKKIENVVIRPCHMYVSHKGLSDRFKKM